MVAGEVAAETGFKGANLVDGHVVHIALLEGEDDECLFGEVERLELALLEDLVHAEAAFELAPGAGVEVAGAELGEGLELAELGVLALQAAGDRLHALRSGRPNPRG